MKKSQLFILGMLGTSVILPAAAERLVILHTNDTHSHISPEANGLGGVLQRKALIDSIRNAEENVILVDAGDVVQGSLYFKFFKGDVEYPLMDLMGYDIRILGNHEFDNGIDDIAKYYRDTKGVALSANYDLTDTPLDGIFSPYAIREIGGKKIGFIGLNLNPSSIIIDENAKGVVYKDLIPVANETAAFLKNDLNCDYVVAVTHIGVEKQNDTPTDYELAEASKDIDIIIGGHSHTEIKPGFDGETPSWVSNANGQPVLVAQTGKYGRNVGYISIDLDNHADTTGIEYRLLPVTDRFAESDLDRDIIDFLAPYKSVVDSVNANYIARSSGYFNNSDRTGGLANLTADIAYSYALHKADSLRTEIPDFPVPDFAFMNVGGIRLEMPEGNISEGQILDTYPFTNHLAIARIKGSDLAEALGIAALKKGESVSSQLLVLTDSARNVKEILFNGYPLDPDKVYTFASIDYLLMGKDGLTPLANSEVLWRDEVEVCAPILDYFVRMGKNGITVTPDSRPRFVFDNGWIPYQGEY